MVDQYVIISIVLEIVGVFGFVLFLGATYWGDYRSPAQVPGPAVRWADRPLPYILRRIGILAGFGYIGLGVDPDTNRGIYPWQVAVMVNLWVDVWLMVALACWIVWTYKALYRQLNRPAPSYLTYVAFTGPVSFGLILGIGYVLNMVGVDQFPTIFLHGILATGVTGLEFGVLIASGVELRKHLYQFVATATATASSPVRASVPLSPRTGTGTVNGDTGTVKSTHLIVVEPPVGGTSTGTGTATITASSGIGSPIPPPPPVPTSPTASAVRVNSAPSYQHITNSVNLLLRRVIVVSVVGLLPGGYVVYWVSGNPMITPAEGWPQLTPLFPLVFSLYLLLCWVSHPFQRISVR